MPDFDTSANADAQDARRQEAERVRRQIADDRARIGDRTGPRSIQIQKPHAGGRPVANDESAGLPSAAESAAVTIRDEADLRRPSAQAKALSRRRAEAEAQRAQRDAKHLKAKEAQQAHLERVAIAGEFAQEARRLRLPTRGLNLFGLPRGWVFDGSCAVGRDGVPYLRGTSQTMYRRMLPIDEWLPEPDDFREMAVRYLASHP